jgi:hypothetical protein
MCFSAEADVAAGIAIGVIAIDGLRHVRRPAEYPLASLPLLLAVHQFIEAFVWWDLEGAVPHSFGRVAAWLYLAIAFGVLPLLIPTAVAALESGPNRRRMLRIAAPGAALAAVLMYAVVRGPILTRIQEDRIKYQVDLWYGGALVVVYILVTCGPLLMSSWRHIRWFGGANLVAAAALAWLSRSGFISLWCLWAAVSSFVIVLHLRLAARPAAESPVFN